MPEQEKTEQTPAVETLQNLLTEKEGELVKYQKLMKDPSIQLVLEKLAKGEDIKLADPSSPPAQKTMKQMLGADTKTEELDIDSLSNKDLVGVMSESVEQYVGQVREEVSAGYQKELAEMKGELLSTQEHLLKMTAQSQVKEIASTHPDFEKYRSDMQKIAEIYPNMSVEDLYVQAKGKHLIESPDIRTIETEKPESSSQFPDWQPYHLRKAEPEGTESSGGPSQTALRNTMSGRKNFANLVSETAQRLLSKQKL